VKERDKDQLRDRVLKELQRDEAEAADGETAEEKDPEEAVKDELKDRLRNLLDR
jgi:hypothetical protein